MGPELLDIVLGHPPIHDSFENYCSITRRQSVQHFMWEQHRNRDPCILDAVHLQGENYSGKLSWNEITFGRDTNNIVQKHHIKTLRVSTWFERTCETLLFIFAFHPNNKPSSWHRLCKVGGSNQRQNVAIYEGPALHWTGFHPKPP